MSPPTNPSFPISVSEAAATLRAIEHAPLPLSRPLVVVSGYMDPGVGAWVLAGNLRRLTTTPDLIIEVPLFSTTTFDSCCNRLTSKIQQRFPSDCGENTVEVDVIGVSMGGLVARAAACTEKGRRLNIRRLFTISTPHRGANLAPLPTFDQRQIDMRAGSEFLAGLDRAKRPYELIPYVRLNDVMVGAENAAPKGEVAWWVPNRPLQPSHLAAHTDPRILADIARRLRGEEPFTTEPRAPLP